MVANDQPANPKSLKILQTHFTCIPQAFKALPTTIKSQVAQSYTGNWNWWTTDRAKRGRRSGKKWQPEAIGVIGSGSPSLPGAVSTGPPTLISSASFLPAR